MCRCWRADQAATRSDTTLGTKQRRPRRSQHCKHPLLHHMGCCGDIGLSTQYCLRSGSGLYISSQQRALEWYSNPVNALQLQKSSLGESSSPPSEDLDESIFHHCHREHRSRCWLDRVAMQQHRPGEVERRWALWLWHSIAGLC